MGIGAILWAVRASYNLAVYALSLIHILPTFFGLVGGVKTMGIVGLFVGPVLMALLVAVWREWVNHEEVERDTARLRAGAPPDKTSTGGQA